MKSQKMDRKSRITALLQSNSLILPSTPPTPLSHKLPAYSPHQIPESNLLNRIIGGVVISKNNQQKQLKIHITTLYNQQKNTITNISCNKYVAYIKDYELKTDQLIFGYLHNFSNVDVGTFVNAWVRRLEKRNGEGCFQLFLGRQAEKNNSNIKLGVVKDNVTIPESVLKVYEKEKTLPINFLIMYQPSYDNPRLPKILEKCLQVDSLSSLHKVSNLSALKKLDYNYHRIRYIQEKSWRDEHLELGIECIKDKQYQHAIECFNLSIQFGPQLPDTHIAKACALVNLGNLSEGIRSIKEALKIDPHNERAKKYYEQFQKQMDYKNEENGNNKKRFSKGYDLVHK